ncbi:MAG: PIN domain-containing protein [Campylobacterota bacterium]|nr:PIN domain-containing protein [Campylobacterota bacterium]
MKIFLDANICLDLLDTTRDNSEDSITWYLNNKDNSKYEFYFSSDFVTTIFFILTQKRNLNPKDVLKAMDALMSEITPCYLSHRDYEVAKYIFYENAFDDFEDLLILSSANRIECHLFITNDKKLLALKKQDNIKIVSIKNLET